MFGLLLQSSKPCSALLGGAFLFINTGGKTKPIARDSQWYAINIYILLVVHKPYTPQKAAATIGSMLQIRLRAHFPMAIRYNGKMFSLAAKAPIDALAVKSLSWVRRV